MQLHNNKNTIASTQKINTKIYAFSTLVLSLMNNFLKFLNSHAPLRRKLLKANHAPYIFKSLREAIMRTQTRNQRGEGEDLPCPFSKIGKKCPNLEK